MRESTSHSHGCVTATVSRDTMTPETSFASLASGFTGVSNLSLSFTSDTRTASSSLFASYADVLAVSQPVRDDLEAILHPETGFAPRLRRICIEQCAALLSFCATESDIP